MKIIRWQLKNKRGKRYLNRGPLEPKGQWATNELRWSPASSFYSSLISFFFPPFLRFHSSSCCLPFFICLHTPLSFSLFLSSFLADFLSFFLPFFLCLHNRLSFSFHPPISFKRFQIYLPFFFHFVYLCVCWSITIFRLLLPFYNFLSVSHLP